MYIQSLVLTRCASASSSDLPAKSGLKSDQFNCGIGVDWIGSMGGTIGCAGGTISCVADACSCTGGAGGTPGGSWGADHLLSAMINYTVGHTTNVFISNPNFNFDWIYKCTKV